MVINWASFLGLIAVFLTSCSGGDRVGVNQSQFIEKVTAEKEVDSLYADEFELFANRFSKKFTPTKLVLTKNDSIVSEIVDQKIVERFYSLLHDKYNRRYHCPSERVYQLSFYKDSIHSEVFIIDRKMYKESIVCCPPGYNRCMVLKLSALELLLNYNT
ncbi:MAG: hypothetical protein N4A35_16090 [Flavobacteriales bacterium]|jgi:hypothetical protein|nr:hypothetical protein [Flavobacteriales bacterium]